MGGRRRGRTPAAALLLLAAAAAGCRATVADAAFTLAAMPDGEPLVRGRHFVLVAEKDGRAPLVAGAPREGEISGTHNFPPGTHAGGIADYYRSLLLNAGWREGTDFRVEGDRLELLGVRGASLAFADGYRFADGR